MKFSNVVAYCKGFYKTREGDVPEMWKDMAHCIMCDGWTIFGKRDVARWCMNRIEDFAKEFPEDAWQVSFCKFYGDMQHNKEIVAISKCLNPDEKDIDELDLIIWTFRDFIRYLDGDKFTEGVIPNEAVLPINKENISKTLWEHIVEKYKEQKDEWYMGTYDERETRINNGYKYNPGN